jgi:hypothetical protein
LSGEDEMSLRKLIIGGALALTVTTASAAEDLQSANAFLPYCKSAIDSSLVFNGFAEGMCMGIVVALAHVAGASDVGMSALNEEGKLRMLKERWRSLCIPNGVTQGQLVRVVVRYLEARPQRLHEPFAEFALEALFDAWPCRPG